MKFPLYYNCTQVPKAEISEYNKTSNPRCLQGGNRPPPRNTVSRRMPQHPPSSTSAQREPRCICSCSLRSLRVSCPPQPPPLHVGRGCATFHPRLSQREAYCVCPGLGVGKRSREWETQPRFCRESFRRGGSSWVLGRHLRENKRAWKKKAFVHEVLLTAGRWPLQSRREGQCWVEHGGSWERRPPHQALQQEAHAGSLGEAPRKGSFGRLSPLMTLLPLQKALSIISAPPSLEVESPGAMKGRWAASRSPTAWPLGAPLGQAPGAAATSASHRRGTWRFESSLRWTWSLCTSTVHQDFIQVMESRRHKRPVGRQARREWSCFLRHPQSPGLQRIHSLTFIVAAPPVRLKLH